MLPMHMMHLPAHAYNTSALHAPHPHPSALHGKPTYIPGGGFLDVFSTAHTSATYMQQTSSAHHPSDTVDFMLPAANVTPPISSSSSSSAADQQHHPPQNYHDIILSSRSAFKPMRQQTPSLSAAAVVVSTAEDAEVTSSDAERMKLPSMEPLLMMPGQEVVAGIDRGEAVFESAAKLLFLAVKWAKSMPSFAQLPLDDQTRLLEESWAELFIVTAVQYGLSAESKCEYIVICHLSVMFYSP